MNQLEINNIVLPILELVIRPLNERLTDIDHKLDKAVSVSERVTAIDSVVSGQTTDLSELKSKVQDLTLEAARQAGRNGIINWALGILSAIVAGVAIAGACALFGLTP